ncbi:MAG: tRNA preQ1(34) S-adenosylmethionine ribosyltransferase-isomerase QueA [Anaerovoracaceae bacterium]|nr:tRNA preQ1(34) S-adenosylmethionine ribosyltransferase-isomerase QueA [Anaerovoracaceae bacterium]
MRVTDFDYDLPEELIAQHPSDRRDGCRLMVVHRKTGEIEHRHFYDIIDYLEPTDCLVMNDSKVIPARLFGVKEDTGAKVEFLLTKRIDGDRWETMVRPGRRLRPGAVVSFAPDFEAEIIDYAEGGTRIVEFRYDGIFMERLEELGAMPLPPYIERPSTKEDRDRYQTVYARPEGSVAAPTAGLHFTKELLGAIENRGVKTAYVTLHVGIGTFRPVKAENVEDHEMHFEEYSISDETAKVINDTKKSGGRIVAVGTTSTRTLESAAVRDGGAWQVRPGAGSTGIFIYPGYEWKMVDSLITNFHLPKSTLMMLISSFYDREKILEAYRTAVEEKYRFFSYGDAMFIE